jgi:hypothetical protein
MGIELSEPVQAAVEGAVAVVLEQIEIMRADARAEQAEQREAAG